MTLEERAIVTAILCGMVLVIAFFSNRNDLSRASVEASEAKPNRESGRPRSRSFVHPCSLAVPFTATTSSLKRRFHHASPAPNLFRSREFLSRMGRRHLLPLPILRRIAD